MDRKNKLSSYIDPAAGENTSSRGGAGQQGRNINTNTKAGGKLKQAGIYPAEGNLDAVANYQNYTQNKPSNPRNSPPRRADRYEADSNGADGSSQRERRSGHAQRPQPRLTYYNEGEGPNGAGGFKETPKQATSSAHRSARNFNVAAAAAARPNSSDRRPYQPDYTNQTQMNRNADLVDSRPQSARARGYTGGGLDSAQLHRERPSGLVVTPGHDDDPYGNNGSFDDYTSPAKHNNGRYSVGNDDENYNSSLATSKHSGNNRDSTGSQQQVSHKRHLSRSAARATGPAEFLVRIHRVRDAFSDFEEANKPKPTTFLALHTTEERGRTGVVADDYNPIFNDEFLFTSSRPDKDALVITLVAAAHQNQHPNRHQSTARDKKIAEAIVSLQCLKRGQERERWVSLVRHAGTAQAYERGEILVSILSDTYGQETLPTEEEEAVYYDEVHDMLVAHAPDELHRLDWFVGNVSRKGPEGLARLRAKVIERSIEPVKVRLTLSEVTGLTAPDGRPTQAETCYIVISTPKGSEVTSKMVPYRRRATFEQTFVVTIKNPDVDAVSLAVFSAGRKLGEAQVGLANLQAGVSKTTSLMLVRAAETGDAAPAGEISVVLQTDGYSSPYRMSADRETHLRERVTAYLWCYLRDDLHRVDAIVAGIDDEDVYMREWARTIGPEKKPKNASLRITRIKDVFGSGNADSGGSAAVPRRVYVRVIAGPYVQRTESASVRSNEVVFKTPLDIIVYDPKKDSVEFMLIEEGNNADSEVSRVVLGTGGLPRGESVVRHVRLVNNALSRSAKTQGEMEVELVAHDFGLPLDVAITEDDKYKYLCDRLQSVTERNNPESLHRVPYMIDSAPPGKVEQTVEQKSKEYGNEIATAPMTLCILGLKDFRKNSDCYVKAFLDGNPILTTRDKRGSSQMTFDIEDNNETTVKLTNASQAKLVFKIGQHHSCKKATVIARTELALRSMVRGERNTVWIPLFEGSANYFQPQKNDGGVDKDGNSGKQKESGQPFSGSRMPTAHSPYGGGSAKPLGLLGVMVQSMAFPGTTVTEYVLDGGAGVSGGGGGGGANGQNGVSAYEAVTYDVTRLLMKYRPQDLSKVQPLIAECASLREAHSELRTRFCPRPVGATVYVNIEKIELATAEGRVQEEQCGVRADVSYGDERQSTIKKREFENDVIHQRIQYPAVRLDLPQPQNANSVSGKDTKGRRDQASSLPDAGAFAAPLEIKLVGVRPGSYPMVSGGDAAGYSSNAASPARYGESSQPNGAEDSMNRGNSGSVSPRRHSLGGANNFNNYLDESTAATALKASQNTAAADSPYAYRSRNTGENPSTALNGSGMYGQGQQHSSSTSRRYDGALIPFSGRTGEALQGEIGIVQLSLRALLSAPIHKAGDTLRVPIVRPPRATSYGQAGTSRTAHHSRNIIGHVTLRITLPAFEVVPEFLRLASRKTLSEVVPDYVHYYERRIGAYLRENSPADLVDFHYKFYERDVASGSWPVSLYDWLQALTKRFGAETTNIYGPEPPLPFDPEERERQRQAGVDQTQLRGFAFPESESASYAGQDGDGWLGEDPFYSDAGSNALTGANGGKPDDIYEVKNEPSTKKSRAARKNEKAADHRTGHRRTGNDEKGGDESRVSQSSRKRKTESAKAEKPLYGF